MDDETQERSLIHRGRWLPGQSGNPAGRPLGARNRFGEKLYTGAEGEYDQHSAQMWEWLRQNPKEWWELMRALRPAQMSIDVTNQPKDRMYEMIMALDPEQKRRLAECILLISTVGEAKVLDWLKGEAAKTVKVQEEQDG
jgi:hypothetical protein